MSAALPAMAGGVPVGKQLHNNSATAEQWIKDGCPDAENVPQCDNHLVITTYSDVSKDRDWAKAGFETALKLHDEGKRVFYVMANDNDGDAQTAVMRTYANGKDLALGVELSVKYGLVSDLHMEHHGTKKAMYEEANKAYQLFNSQLVAKL